MTLARREIRVQGAVQGVGFRPFVYRLAQEHDLTGWVQNMGFGVHIEVQGPESKLDVFLERLRRGAPGVSTIQSVFTGERPTRSPDPGFQILDSDTGDVIRPVVTPDLAVCSDCTEELLNPRDRRHRYPFLSCAHCGPRYSIVHDLPFDRCRTSLRTFPLCERCQEEYEDPGNRRFHAQTIGCPDCGPSLVFRDATGRPIASSDEAVRRAVALLLEGGILAVKGIGGFQLVVDAGNEAAVQTLRTRKHRPDKPMAVMFPDLRSLTFEADCNPEEMALLRSPAAPIVLLTPRSTGTSRIAPGVARGCPRMGSMLPTSPLHLLVSREAGRPLVVTSGNRTEEPIASTWEEASAQLSGIADGFLDHDRIIVNAVDDSVAMVVDSVPVLLRRARGYTPTTLSVPYEGPPLLAVGAEEKSTVTLLHNGEAQMSPYLGSLRDPLARERFRRTIDRMERWHRQKAQWMVSDHHPDCASSRMAEERAFPRFFVGHHEAHVAAVMAEHHLRGSVLGFAWDGLGLGLDGALWGSEIFRVENDAFERVGHLAPYPLLGGDAAARDPVRCALGLLSVLGRLDAFAWAKRQVHPERLALYQSMLDGKTCVPPTTSMGRLFDGVAALLGHALPQSHEAQAAMALECLAEHGESNAPFPYHFSGDGSMEWTPMIEAILRDPNRGTQPENLAHRFHRTLVEMIVGMAKVHQIGQVVLSGGCFQNHLLLREAKRALQRAGFDVFHASLFPPNDGGLSLGQAYLASRHWQCGKAEACA